MTHTMPTEDMNDSGEHHLPHPLRAILPLTTTVLPATNYPQHTEGGVAQETGAVSQTTPPPLTSAYLLIISVYGFVFET